MKIPKNIEKMTWNISTSDSFERINEMIDAINFLLERARKEEVENVEIEGLKGDTKEKGTSMTRKDIMDIQFQIDLAKKGGVFLKGDKNENWQIKADAVRRFTDWVIDEISECGWIDDMPVSRFREMAEEFLGEKR